MELVVKNSPVNAEDTRDTGSGWGRSPGGEHGNACQYSCLENPMNRGAWWAIVHRFANSRTRWKQLCTVHACINRGLRQLFGVNLFLGLGVQYDLLKMILFIYFCLCWVFVAARAFL